MPTPLVSVVIPTYNQPLLLTEAIDSVLRQTMTDREIIVVNDGSTDNTLEHLARYGERIRVITQENGWVGAARNRGIDEARGKYVATLDHDDYWMPEKLFSQVEFLERNSQCIAATVPYAASDKPDEPVFRREDICDSDGIVRHPFRYLAQGSLFIGTSALMFDREKARGLRYGTVRGAIEDVQFHIGLCGRGPFGVAGEKILAVWRRHALNTSKNTLYNYHGIKLLRSMDRRGELADLSGQERRDLSEFLGMIGRNAALHMLLTGQRAKSLEMYAREFFHQLRMGRLRFLTMYPPLLLLPKSLACRCFGIA